MRLEPVEEESGKTTEGGLVKGWNHAKVVLWNSDALTSDENYLHLRGALAGICHHPGGGEGIFY